MIRIYIDGGSRGNPGAGALGFVVMNAEAGELFRYGKAIGFCTNNIAEYRALIEALHYIHTTGTNEAVTIYSDSELLVNQMNRKYKVKSANILPLYEKSLELIKKLKNVRIKHIKREENGTADWIVNRVLDGKPYRPADRSRELLVPEESPGS